MKFFLNGKPVEFTGEQDTPLLWVLRDHLHLTGTKFGCGIGACGACTVHVDDKAVRSCCYPLALVEGRQVTTIEGLTQQVHRAVQQAWIEEDVPQCGYCQTGWIMAASALLQQNPQPSDAEIDQKLTNLCRCATYHRIRKAIHRASQEITRHEG